jgi:heme oxygenase
MMEIPFSSIRGKWRSIVEDLLERNEYPSEAENGIGGHNTTFALYHVFVNQVQNEAWTVPSR